MTSTTSNESLRPAGSPRVTLVTGSTSGIGAVIADYFAAKGDALVLVGRNEEVGDRIVERLAAQAREALFLKVDVRREDEVRHAFGAAVDRFGRVDVVVNCAGVQIEKPLHELNVEEWDIQMETNLRGYFLVSREAVRRWLSDNSPGVLVHVSSGLGLLADSLLGAYSVTKSGQILLSHALAVAYGSHGIRSNAVCPGSVATESFERWASSTPTGEAKRSLLEEMYPSGRIVSPLEVAMVVHMLASDEARGVSGAVVAIDGGFGSMSQHNVLYSESFVAGYARSPKP